MSCAAIALRCRARHFMLDDFGVDSVARGARPDGESDRVTLIRDLLDVQ